MIFTSISQAKTFSESQSLKLLIEEISASFWKKSWGKIFNYSVTIFTQIHFPVGLNKIHIRVFLILKTGKTRLISKSNIRRRKVLQTRQISLAEHCSVWL